jgi:hypothetical protein
VCASTLMEMWQRPLNLKLSCHLWFLGRVMWKSGRLVDFRPPSGSDLRFEGGLSVWKKDFMAQKTPFPLRHLWFRLLLRNSKLSLRKPQSSFCNCSRLVAAVSMMVGGLSARVDGSYCSVPVLLPSQPSWNSFWVLSATKKFHTGTRGKYVRFRVMALVLPLFP